MSEIAPFTGYDDRVKLADVVPLESPYVLNIFPSNACNLRCVYCVHALSKDDLEERYQFRHEIMSMDTFNNIFQFERRFKLISFTGQGEPLLNKNLPLMIRIAKIYADRVDIVTNGVLLHKELNAKLIDSGLDILRISLQGVNQDEYLKIGQRKLNFDSFIDNITDFYVQSRGKCKLYVKIINLSSQKNFFEMFGGITDRMFVEHVKPVYHGVDYSKWDMSPDTDRRGLEHPRRDVCPFPFYQLDVWPNGDVVPCPAIHKIVLGNVNEMSLKDMWNSDKLRKFRMMHLSGDRGYHHQCGVCCAPDDCAHPEDVLDDNAEEILRRI